MMIISTNMNKAPSRPRGARSAARAQARGMPSAAKSRRSCASRPAPWSPNQPPLGPRRRTRAARAEDSRGDSGHWDRTGASARATWPPSTRASQRGTSAKPASSHTDAEATASWVTEFSGKASYQEMRGFAGREKQAHSGALGAAKQQLAS